MNRDYKKLFGLEFMTEQMETPDLPIYLTAGRVFCRLSNDTSSFILVKIPENERFGVVAFEKQIRQFSAKFDMPVALGFENITRTQRDSLIERNIPFISESGQLYLPFLGIALSDRFLHSPRVRTEKMMPVTQALFLYMLYQSNGRPIMKKDAAEAIGATRTSITRASEQLAAMYLISQEMKGKEYYMTLQGAGIEAFESAKPFLINPVQRIITVADKPGYGNYPLSGESALAKHTMLNDPVIPVRAVIKSLISPEQVTEIDIRWEPGKKAVNMELWKYDPCLFMRNGTVDPVSLAMTFENNADERIEGAIEEVLEGYQW